MTLAEVLLKALKDYGAKEIFGIPGDFALPFFKYIEETKTLPLYTLSHEPGVGFAADAAARHHSSLGVACVTYGAGALNMVNPIAQAYSEKSPVVVISGAPGALEGSRGLGLHHQAKRLDSQFQIYKEITCDQVSLTDAKTAPALISRALGACLEQSRPVYIEVPRDMVDVVCAEVPPYCPSPSDAVAARACAHEVMARLSQASSPVLMAGVEVRRYGLEDKVAKLATKLGIPTTTSFLARGSFAESDVPMIGTYLGLAGESEVCTLVEGSDALLMLGVILCDTNFGVSQKKIDMRSAILAFDREVRFAHHLYPHVSLEALVDALLDIAKPIGKANALSAPALPRGLADSDEALSPTAIAKAVNDLFDQHGKMAIAADMGDCLFTAVDIANTALLAPGYYASMGFGVPAGLGLQAASGKRPLIMVGDGAFQMTGWELGNCRQYGWSPIVLLFNNRSWEMLRTFQPGPSYHDLDDWKFAEAAASMGGHGKRVHTCGELKTALKAAYDDPSQFHIIEVMLERGAISRTLERFVGAVKRLSQPVSEKA